ncbi:Sterol 3-beta-glucosyltransferase [Pyricularia oryzae]|nr:Sterol 3-beta-glucosyltransferase [Pyricularia oryzae]
MASSSSGQKPKLGLNLPLRSPTPGTASPPLVSPHLPRGASSHHHRIPPTSLLSPNSEKPSRHSEDDPKKRIRKLQKRRHNGAHSPTMEIPERLRESDPEDEDDDTRRPPFTMNQSIFGLIAAAGSAVDFNDRFEGASSDEDDDGADGDHELTFPRDRRRNMAQTAILRRSRAPDESLEVEKKRRKGSGHKLLRSLPQISLPKRLSSLSKKSKSSKSKEPQINEEDEADESQSSPGNSSPTIESSRNDGRLPPVMSRILEARAELSLSRPSLDLDRIYGSNSPTGEGGPSALAIKLKEIFEFDQVEAVMDEYPCWLLQSVLLQGYLYITSNHICFYAYLPKKANEVVKSGYLSKSGKRNPKYNRYWFRLKGDVLAYYRDPSNLYFPSGQIDLRYGISATVTDKDKDGLNFTVVTHQRSYHFRADSAPSAGEWVKSLQRVIFRSHNEGDSVKISLPIRNVMDVEEMQVVQFAETCKIRVIDNDETYAIDEYFFSFFSFGKEAINVIKAMVDQRQDGQKNDARGSDEDSPSVGPPSKSSSVSGGRDRPPRLSKINDNVRATLAPMSPTSPTNPSPRASGDFSRSSFDALRNFGRRSLDLDSAVREESQVRRSFSGHRHARSRSRPRLSEHEPIPEKHGSSDSYIQSSTEDPSLASISGVIVSGSEDQSASQILKGSDVFHSPTIRRAGSSSRKGDTNDKSSDKHISKARPQAGNGHSPDFNNSDKPSRQSEGQVNNMASLPVRGAGALAGYLNRPLSPFRRMSNLLATESMGYVEKVSGMWKGGHRHYDEAAALKTDDELVEDEDEEKVATSRERFRQHFALPESEKLVATYFGHMIRVLPLYGKIYISDRSFCFRSLLPGTRTKLILPLKDIENGHKEKGFRFGYSGLVVVIKGHEELFFEFGQAEVRDDCAITLLQQLESSRYLQESGMLGQDEKEDAENAVAERDALQSARQEERPTHEIPLPKQTSVVSDAPTILFDDPKASFLNFKPPNPLRITCLTIGSRGDVQPYIALAKGLLREGHEVRIATHAEFEPWIRSHGIDFRKVEGDPGELMQLCIENGTFTWQFLKVAASKFRGWLDELLSSCWQACQGSDLLIESPSAMAGIHIAEALQIPYFRAFTMPWTRTRAYPHAFVMPEHKMGGAYNYVTYVMFDNMFWKMTAQQINRWRNVELGIPNTSLEKMQPNKVPFLYNFSPYVVPPPLDYSDWIRVTGYWFLDEGTPRKAAAEIEDGDGSEEKSTDQQGEGKNAASGSNWTPPPELADFIEQARADKKKLVYVGFGSIIVNDPVKLTQEVIDAVIKSDVRCILSKGWSDRMSTGSNATDPKPAEDGEKVETDQQPVEKKEEPKLPPEILQIKSAPHDWLFAQVDAVAHHGGSGTTGASLRAGVPTIIRPFFGDQFFFGARVEDLGVGICVRKWGTNAFARALWEATNSERMIVKARVLGEQIRKENGVETAIQCIYRDMEYAKSLIKAKANKNTKQQPSKQEGHGGEVHDDEGSDDHTEEWTFVGGNDPGDGGAEFPDAAYRRQESAKSGDASVGLGLGLGASSSGGGKALGSKVLSGA